MTALRTIPHQSRELIAVSIALNGATVDTGVEVAFVPIGTDPAEDAWAAASVAADGQIGYLLSGSIPKGIYELYVRVNASAERPVRVNHLIELV